eukprot:tig00000640_g2758.t1
MPPIRAAEDSSSSFGGESPGPGGAGPGKRYRSEPDFDVQHDAEADLPKVTNMGLTLDMLAELLGACADMDRLFNHVYVQIRRNCNWMLAAHLKMPEEPLLLDTDNFANNCRTLASESRELAAACTAIARMSAGMEPDDLFSEFANRFEKHSARFAISSLFWGAYPMGEWSYSNSRDPEEHGRLAAQRSQDAEQIVAEIKQAQEESQHLVWEQAMGMIVSQTQSTEELGELAARWKGKADRMGRLFKLSCARGIRFGPPPGGPGPLGGGGGPPIRFD